MKDYGKELILDLHNCNVSFFTRRYIEAYFRELCKIIDMERGDLFWWDDLYTPEEYKQTDPKITGTSAIQFILTSNITIHTLDKLKRVYVNIFSCKDFNDLDATIHTVSFFEGTMVNKQIIRRI